MRIYYINEDNTCGGDGESYTLPENATESKPAEGQVWNGTAWEDVVLTAEELAEATKLEAKATVDATLSVLQVTTSTGNTFDANTEARQNMADAILASDTLGMTETVWRLADNSEALIGIVELREAHALAIQKYAEIKGIGA